MDAARRSAAPDDEKELVDPEACSCQRGTFVSGPDGGEPIPVPVEEYELLAA